MMPDMNRKFIVTITVAAATDGCGRGVVWCGVCEIVRPGYGSSEGKTRLRMSLLLPVLRYVPIQSLTLHHSHGVSPGADLQPIMTWGGICNDVSFARIQCPCVLGPTKNDVGLCFTRNYETQLYIPQVAFEGLDIVLACMVL